MTAVFTTSTLRTTRPATRYLAGLNTSDRALPVSFTVKTSEVAGDISALNVRYDVFAMADCILYISLDGKLSTRI